MNIQEAILKRKSDRTFDQRELPEKLVDEMIAVFDQSDRLSDLDLRLVPMAGKSVEHAMTGLVGSYGKIMGAPIWVIGISKSGPFDQLNFGFAMEQFVLECTRNGLGTCWVGGFFKMSELDEAVPKSDDERIICISPLGYAAPRRFMERSMRKVGGLDRRKPLAERVFFQKWGATSAEYLDADPKLKTLFEMARWAPSASNRQPCHYVFNKKRIALCILTSLQTNYPKLLTMDRAEDLNFQQVDAGIAMAHIHLAAPELGLSGKWNLDPGVVLKMGKMCALPSKAKIIATYDFD